MRPGPIGEPRSRESSGTAWLPDASAMHALHGGAGGWELMLHGSLYIHYLADGGERGREQFGSTNWAMGMARRPALGGELTFRAMLSADPVTATECGYPDLLATGELCDGEPLHDRQHPHDLFMELAAVYERALTDDVALQLYGGPVGEPALGPVAFPHRISSFPNPIAPIGHHWLDSTHIAFGVATAGLYGIRWKAEASVFNGREPDGDRYDLDLDALDSYAGRLWFLPGERWALQVSAGRLNDAEAHEAGASSVDVTRATAAASYHRPLSAGGNWASTLAWGRNREAGQASHALLAETNVNLAQRDLVFGRFEIVEKSGEDLVLPDELAEETFTVSKLGLGYLRQFRPLAGLAPGLGGGITISFVPRDLEAIYGSRRPVGLQLFFRLRPEAMAEAGHEHGGLTYYEGVREFAGNSRGREVVAEKTLLPTDAELRILRVLWDRGAATVREVFEELEDDRGYTTILKLLQIMDEKGLVTRRRDARSHVYSAAVEREPTQRALLRNLVEKAFAGSSDALVLRALSTRGASPDELAEVRKLLARLEEGGGGA